MKAPAAAAVKNKNGTGHPAGTDQERLLLEACLLTPEECLARLGSREKGLAEEEVEDKRREYGRNEVSTKQGGLLLRTYHRVANPLVVQLLIIAGVSLAMGDLRSFLVVGGMLVLSVGLSSLQEERSGRAVDKLQAMVRTTVNVMRDG
ncbi:MAG TPA: cation-transporting P-type ATPase, partial [Spirochaetia bacterium]|nr:cation-transporting P-type ATPase [Spirochaetia bacterium]